jgi:hypothetical protein
MLARNKARSSNSCKYLRADYEHNFLFKTSQGTRGGILLASKESRFNLQSIECAVDAITQEFFDCANNAL